MQTKEQVPQTYRSLCILAHLRLPNPDLDQNPAAAPAAPAKHAAHLAANPDLVLALWPLHVHPVVVAAPVVFPVGFLQRQHVDCEQSYQPPDRRSHSPVFRRSLRGLVESGHEPVLRR